MNLNKSLSFKIKMPKLTLALLQKTLPPVVGLALIALFTLTALSVKKAVTVLPPSNVSVDSSVPSFDEQTIKSIKGLLVVPATPNTTNLGKSDPFN